MKKKIMKLLVLFLLVSSITNIEAQQTTDASGGNASGSGGTTAYSVGQIVYTTHNGSNGSVAQGVQQPYEISIITGMDNPAFNLALLAYPNPTNHYLNLTISDSDLSNLRFQLLDTNGKLIEGRRINSTNEIIQMENLPAAIYFLTIIYDNTEVKTFKITKN